MFILKPLRIIRKSIYRKLALSFILAGLIPLLAISFLFYTGYVSSMEDKTVRYSYEVMKLFGDRMENFIKQVDQITYTMYQDNMQLILDNLDKGEPTDRVRGVMELDRLFRLQLDFHNFSGRIKTIFILDPKGKNLYENTGSVYGTYDFFKLEGFNNFMEEGHNSAIIPPYIQPDLKKLIEGKTDLQPSVKDFTLSYIRRIGNVKNPNKNMGYIILNFGLDEVEGYLQPLISGENSEITVLDRNNRVVYYKDLSLIGTIAEDQFKDKEEDKSKGYFIKNEGSKRYLVTYYELKETGWKIFSTNDIGELTRDTAGLRKIAIILTIIAVLVLVLFSILISYGLLNPVKKLRKAMVKVHNGDLNASVSNSSVDEIGELGSVFNEMLDKIRHLVNEVYTTQLSEKEAQLNALQAQINPHFLYNTLENIRSIAHVEGIDDISRMALSMSNMFRYSIKLGGAYVKISDEMKHVNDYLTILSIRFDDKFQVRIDIPEELMDCQIIKLILQPVVENAVHHGLELKCEKGLLEISAREVEGTIELVISDDGVGMSEETLEKIKESLDLSAADNKESTGNSIGINNVHNRIRLYYGRDYGLSIESRLGEGTRVTIRLPLIRL